MTLPARLPLSLGIAVYRAASRISGAPYIEDMLAEAALNRGDLAGARQYAQRLPRSTRRDDLLGRIAQARGRRRLADEYFARAGDIVAIDRTVRDLTQRDPARAYALEDALLRRLERSGTHPDQVAEAYWRLGNLAWRQSKRALGMQNYARAVTLSPLSEKFLLSAGFAAYESRDDVAAQQYFTRVLGMDPASADAYAGAGMVALRMGQRARARHDAQRAQALNPQARALRSLQTKLRKP